MTNTLKTKLGTIAATTVIATSAFAGDLVITFDDLNPVQNRHSRMQSPHSKLPTRTLMSQSTITTAKRINQLFVTSYQPTHQMLHLGIQATVWGRL